MQDSHRPEFICMEWPPSQALCSTWGNLSFTHCLSSGLSSSWPDASSGVSVWPWPFSTQQPDSCLWLVCSTAKIYLPTPAIPRRWGQLKLGSLVHLDSHQPAPPAHATCPYLECDFQPLLEAVVPIWFPSLFLSTSGPPNQPLKLLPDSALCGAISWI